MPEGPSTQRDLPTSAYAAALVAYVVLGLVVKSVVLNWIVGPLFLLITLYLLPRAVRRLRAR